MREVKLTELLIESVIPSLNPNADKRLRVKLNCGGVEKRPLLNESGTTKYYTRKADQFVYGRQNLFKGAFGIVPQELDGYESSTDLPAFDVSDACIPEWIIYFLQAGERYKHLETLSKGSGSKRIHPNDFLELAIPLPPVEEQKVILAKIHKTEATYNKTTNELQTQSDLIAKLRTSILSDAVSGRLVPQDPNDESASILLEKIRAEKERLIKEGKIKREKPLSPIAENEIPYELPDGWVWCRLSSIAEIGTGATPLKATSGYYNGTIPWITSSATGERYIEEAEVFITEKALQETNCKIYPIGTLILAMYGQGKTRGQISELCINATINQACASIRLFLFNKTTNEYIKMFFEKHYVELRELAAGGAQPNLNLQKIKDTLIPLPPFSEQQRIISKVKQLMRTCDALEVEVAKSRIETDRLMQTILKEAFDVSENE